MRERLDQIWYNQQMAKKRISKKKSLLNFIDFTKLKNLRLKDLILPAIIILLIILLGLLKDQFVAASVNGKQINRIELIRELEKKEGRRTLENLISEELILQEAEKRNISVTNEEVDREIGTIEEAIKNQGQKLDDLLTLQGLTRQQLKDEVRIQLILKKLVVKTEITDKEVEEYIEKNNESIPADANMEEIKSQVRTQLEQDKVNQKIQSLVDELRKNAKVEYLLKL